MDYSYFTTAPHPYQYMSYSANDGLLSKEELGDTLSLDAVEVADLGLRSFDFGSFDATDLNDLSPQLYHTGSASPPQHRALSSKSGSVDSGIGLDPENECSRRTSSEEKDKLTPAQSRRKAQNRAAQRAFRERKERHVRDLETKVTVLSKTTSSLQLDNKRLRLLLRRAQTENEILKATASSSPRRHLSPGLVAAPSLPHSSQQSILSTWAEELERDPRKLSHDSLSTEPASPHFDASSGGESHPVSASAAWDVSQSQLMFLYGAENISEVRERIMKLARYEKASSMLQGEEVRNVMEKVGSTSGEELI